MTKDEMIRFIEQHLSTNINRDLYEDVETDMFPKNPPTTDQWDLLIDELVRSGRILETPNRSHVLSYAQPKNLVTHIDNSVKDSIIITQSRIDNSQIIKTNNQSTNQDGKWWHLFWIPLLIAVISGLILLSIEYDWFDFAKK